jgi:hypothetical protein
MTTPTIPNCEPREITRGATVAWTRSLFDYPPADGWTLTTYFRGTGKGVDVEAEADGSDYDLTLTAAQSASMAPGRYDWQSWVARGAGESLEQHQVGEGVATVKIGFTAVDADTPVDLRSENELNLAAVRAALGKAVDKNKAEYSIAQRMKREHSIPDLIAWESRLVQLVNQERQAASLRRGAPFLRNVYTRFK